MFSPSGRRLAVAGFRANRIAIFEIVIDTAANGDRVRLTDVVEIEASTLDEPHGLCFLDEHTLIIANRQSPRRRRDLRSAHSMRDDDAAPREGSAKVCRRIGSSNPHAWFGGSLSTRREHGQVARL